MQRPRCGHQLGIVHRDLKPANLRITPDQRLKILDFGLAKLLLVDLPSPSALTAAAPEFSGISGTLPYIAPEQVAGGAVDVRTDIHAAGAVLYEMATGRHPFAEAQNPVALIAAIIGESPVAPARVRASVSAALERVILRCLDLIGRAIRGGHLSYPNLETDPLLKSLRSRSEYPGLVADGRRVQQDFIEYLRDSRPS